jgi:hypothetical protein
MPDPSPGSVANTKRANVPRARTPWAPVFRLLAWTAPRLAAAVAERMFFTPPPPRRSRGNAMLVGGRPFRIAFEGSRVAGWRWGSGPAVVLLHGWGGHSGQLTSFVAPFLSRGLSVVAMDSPGHGRSSRG